MHGTVSLVLINPMALDMDRGFLPFAPKKYYRTVTAVLTAGTVSVKDIASPFLAGTRTEIKVNVLSARVRPPG